jgi:signal transduction histidine kinase
MRKILIVDDLENNLKLLQIILNINLPDHKVITANSGEDAIKIAKKQLPDTILLDIIMLDMNGFDVCEILKKDDRTKHIPIIMVSALFENLEERLRALNVGVDAFITKPFDKSELILQVKSMLRIKHAEDHLKAQNRNLKILNSELILAEEKERRKIAEYLHDGISQTLSFINIRLTSLLNDEHSQKTKKIIRESSDMVKNTIAESRLLTYDLSPPILYELGLIPAIQWKLDQIGEKYNLNTLLQTNNIVLDFNDDVKILLYRTICELLANIIKHANANLINIEIVKENKYFCISVKDNGKGFRYKQGNNLSENKGFGLFSIHERLELINGFLSINSDNKKGTEVIVKILANKK